MSNGATYPISLDELDKSILELRKELNELCVTMDETEKYKERLRLSRRLDKLIVKYMLEVKNMQI